MQVVKLVINLENRYNNKMKNKLYTSRQWLINRYVAELKSAEEIAKICGVSKQTIFNYLHKFGLVK